MDTTSCSDHHHFYPLTTLQIGDTKTNLSLAFLYFAADSKKLYFLVDNQSWRNTKHSLSTLIWAFLTIWYRTSPFTNTRQGQRSSISTNSDFKRLLKWIPRSVDKALHGLVVFEVPWRGVRSIKYSNELQKDGSIALEVKSSEKWEFDSVDQAVRSMELWFSGTQTEVEELKTHLDSDIASDCSQINDDDDTFHDCIDDERNGSLEGVFGPKNYRDFLFVCGFDNGHLPLELKQIIISDPRLLTLLESGLPHWVIFLQSYPLLCSVYRPWMTQLVRTLYVLVSIVTVVIGFYDLYKNVPLLKSTVSRLYGPFFEWIETWDMVSRIRCLGTIFFLQNFEKALKGLVMLTQWLKLLVSAIRETVTYPMQITVDYLMPLWTFLSQSKSTLFCNAYLAVLELFRFVVDCFDDFLIPPFELAWSCLSGLATMGSKIIGYLWEFIKISRQVYLDLAEILHPLVWGIYDTFAECFEFAISIVGEISYSTFFVRARPNSSYFSSLHSLWNDLLSKIFRSLQSIIRVLHAFSAYCKSQRARAIIRKPFMRFFRKKCSCRQEILSTSHLEANAEECPKCK